MSTNKKILIVTILLVVCVCGTICVFTMLNSRKIQAKVNKEDVYDIILFWGQSNMVGTTSAFDERFTSNEASDISLLTGLPVDILQNSPKMNITNVTATPNTIFEYKLFADGDTSVAYNEIYGNSANGSVYDECIGIENNKYYIKSSCTTIGTAGKLEPIYADANHFAFGENLSVIREPYSRPSEIVSYDTYDPSKPMATQQSIGVNMVPEFCKTYYEKTGRKVIAVVAAMGGQRISGFLQDALQNGGIAVAEPQVANIYEAIHAKFTAAINYLVKQGLFTTDSRSYYVVMQGETDVYDAAHALSNNGYTEEQLKDMYIDNFTQVHNNLKNHLGIQKGVIIETAIESGLDASSGLEQSGISTQKVYNAVETIHQAQVEIATKNDDISIGSTYIYDRYVPDEVTYNSQSYTKNHYYQNMDWNAAKASVTYNVGVNTTYEPAYAVYGNYNNAIHYNSSTLSYVGRDAANNITNELISSISVDPNIKKVYIKDQEQFDLNNSLYINYKDGTTRLIPMSSYGAGVIGFDNSIKGKQTLTINYWGNTTKLDITIMEKTFAYTVTSINNTLNNISEISVIPNADIEVYNSKNIKLDNSSLLGTGYKVLINTDDTINEYITIVKGDTTGDAKIDFNDVARLYHHFRNIENMDNIYQTAGDVATNSLIDFNDVTKLYHYYRNLIPSL